MIYYMDLNWKLHFDVEANSPQEAIALAQKVYPNHDIDHITDQAGFSSSVSQCEGCGEIILDDDTGFPDDGGTFCKGCSEAAASQVITECVTCGNRWLTEDMSSCSKCHSGLCPDCVCENCKVKEVDA